MVYVNPNNKSLQLSTTKLFFQQLWDKIKGGCLARGLAVYPNTLNQQEEPDRTYRGSDCLFTGASIGRVRDGLFDNTEDEWDPVISENTWFYSSLDWYLDEKDLIHALIDNFNAVVKHMDASQFFLEQSVVSAALNTLDPASCMTVDKRPARLPLCLIPSYNTTIAAYRYDWDRSNMLNKNKRWFQIKAQRCIIIRAAKIFPELSKAYNTAQQTFWERIVPFCRSQPYPLTAGFLLLLYRSAHKKHKLLPHDLAKLVKYRDMVLNKQQKWPDCIVLQHLRQFHVKIITCTHQYLAVDLDALVHNLCAFKAQSVQPICLEELHSTKSKVSHLKKLVVNGPVLFIVVGNMDNVAWFRQFSRCRHFKQKVLVFTISVNSK